MDVAPNYKTYAGIILMFFNMVRVGDYITETEIAGLINAFVGVAGIGLAVYGRYMAGKRAKEELERVAVLNK